MFWLTWIVISLLASTLVAYASQRNQQDLVQQDTVRHAQRFAEHLEHLYSATRVMALVRQSAPESPLAQQLMAQMVANHPEILHLQIRPASGAPILFTYNPDYPQTPWPTAFTSQAADPRNAQPADLRIHLEAPQLDPKEGQILEVVQQLPSPNKTDPATHGLQLRLLIQAERALEHAGLGQFRFQLRTSAAASFAPSELLRIHDGRQLALYDPLQRPSLAWIGHGVLFLAFMLLLGLPIHRRWSRQQLRTQQTLQAAHRLADQARSRIRLLGSLSHDLRTPLTRLRLRAEEHPDTRAANLHDLVQIEQFVNASLEYLRNEPSDEPPRALDLDSLIRNWIALGFDGPQDRLLEIPIEVKGRIRQPYIGRPMDLQRCLQNLLTNALRYGAPPITLELFDDNAAVRIQVRDHGPGIPEQDLERLQRPFQRGSRSTSAEPLLISEQHNGYGLGLAIARELCEAQLGELRLRNADDGGLIAEMWLPR